MLLFLFIIHPRSHPQNHYLTTLFKSTHQSEFCIIFHTLGIKRVYTALGFQFRILVTVVEANGI